MDNKSVRTLKNLLREPLVHFLLIGAILFGVFGTFGGDEENNDRIIKITPADIDLLRNRWAMQLKRPPTELELQGLIRNHIREEILFREAKALKLEQDDIIIRRRLVQKMEFLSNDLAVFTDPDKEDIAAYFEENKENYRQPGLVTFSHIYFNVDQRGKAAAQQAAELLRDQLNAQPELKTYPPDLGDRIMLQNHFEQTSINELENLFGNSQLTQSLFKVEMNTWQGPIASNYGFHLVYVNNRTESRLPELTGVQERVRQDLAFELRKKANDGFFAALKSQYAIEISDVLPNVIDNITNN
jgi:hypothetical protein